jgi:hypothetical protein
MPRREFYTGKYALSKEEFLSAKYYALRYNAWLAEYNSLKDSMGAITVDDMPHAKNNISNPNQRLAERRAELREKMEIIEQAAKDANPEIARELMIMATNYDMTFERLKAECDIPYESTQFYKYRRKFYYLLSKKI